MDTTILKFLNFSLYYALNKIFGYKDVKFSLKAVINKQKTKVLFAEIDSDFADILLCFLTLPLGKIVRALENHYGDAAPFFGSLTTMYRGLSNLDGSHFWSDDCKKVLLNPPSSFSDECRKLKLDIFADCDCSRNNIFDMYHCTFSGGCNKYMMNGISVGVASKAADGNDRVFTVSTMTYVLSDDLLLLPNVTASVRQIVQSLGLTDIDGSECRNVTFGFNEIMDLLRNSLFFSTPLTNVILKKQPMYKPIRFKIEKIKTPTDDVGLNVKVVLQKSTTKLLFLEAEEDFVDFLFSLLIIPLGKAESLLCFNTGLKNIDNLFRSIASPIDFKYLSNPKRIRLINFILPHGYLSKNHIFPLVERAPPALYNYQRAFSYEEYMHHGSSSNRKFKSPRVDGTYVKGPRKYMVKDDLTVIQLCLESFLSTINEQGIPLSDVDERVLKIGLQEASGILKASLTTTCALSEGLKHLLMMQPKQER